jgi:multiple sugar transport system ATP-binding protein
MSRIDVIDFRKSYETSEGTVEAVTGVNLSIAQGEYLALLGPSGCGKSSTLRCLAGLETVTAGDIQFDGESVKDLPPAERNVALAFENYALYPPLSVRENLAFPLRSRKMSESEIKRRIDDVVELLDLQELLDRRPRDLSGGQKQRVSLGRAIIRQPRLLLLDEPLSHVDTAQRIPIRTKIRALQQELGLTTIHVTHDQGEAVAMADRIAVMGDGVIHQIGTPRKVFEDPADQFVADFVGEPPINLIRGRIEAADGSGRFIADTGEGRITIPTTVPAGFADRPAVLAARPHQITIVPNGGDADVRGEVLLWEWLGEEGQADIDVGGEIFQVVSTANLHLERHSTVGLRFPKTRQLLFDVESGKRLALQD